MMLPMFHKWRFLVGIAMLALILSWLTAGAAGLSGMALGLFATSFSVIALWGVVRTCSGAASAGFAGRFGVVLTVLAFLVKLPLFVILGMWAQNLGAGAAACFLAGLGLVYLALVGWALASR